MRTTEATLAGEPLHRRGDRRRHPPAHRLGSGGYPGGRGQPPLWLFKLRLYEADVR